MEAVQSALLPPPLTHWFQSSHSFDRTHHSIPVQVVHNIWILVFPHNQDLIDNQFFLRLLLKIHLFYGDLKSNIFDVQLVIQHLLSTYSVSKLKY